MSSIPLPALSIRPPQEPDLAGNVERLMALKSMLGSQQMQQQDIALKQQQVQDQKTVMGYLQQNPGSTFGDAADALKGKISLPAYTNLVDTDATIRQKHAAATDAELKNFQGVHDAQQKIYNNVANLSDEDLAKQWPSIAQEFNSIPGNTAKVDPNQPLTGQQLQQHGAILGLQEAYLKQEADKRKEVAETAEAQSKGAEAASGASKNQAEALWYKQHPEAGAPGIPAENISAADWLAKNPGKTFSDYTVAMKKIVPAYNFSLQNNSGAGQPAANVAKQFGMTPEAFDQAAEKYYQTGNLPAIGRGTAGPALQKAIMNRTGELHPGASLAAGSAEYAANKTSLASLQKNFDQVTAFENTAGKNLDTFLGTAKKIVDSGSPLINRPLRSVTQSVAGSENMAAFDAARTTALTEIAKVLNSSNASGVLSDSARSEVSGLIGPDATLKQIYSAANILKQDMGNRHQSYQQQITDIQGRMGGKANASGDPSNFSVTDPRGKVHYFPDQQSADNFKKAANIQ